MSMEDVELPPMNEVEALHAEYGVPLPEAPAEPAPWPEPPTNAPRLHGWWLGPQEWNAVRLLGQSAVVVNATGVGEGDLVVLVAASRYRAPTNFWLNRTVVHVRVGGLYVRPSAELVSLRTLRKDDRAAYAPWMREVAAYMQERRIFAVDTERPRPE